MMDDLAPQGFALGPEAWATQGVVPRSRFGDFLRAAVAQGWWNSLAGQAMAHHDAAAADDGAVYASEREWRASPEWREGLRYEPGLTRGRARFLARLYDENREREDVLARRKAGIAGWAAGFGAMMLGGLPTPENFVPIFGPAARAAAALRFGTVGGRALVGAAEAGLVTAAVSPLVLASQAGFGDEVGLADAALDVAVGSAIGAVLGAGSGALAIWRGRNPAYAPPRRAQLAALAALDDAATALAEGRPVALDPALARDLARLRRGPTETEVAADLARMKEQLAEAQRLREEAERALAAARRQADAQARLAEVGPGVEVEVRAGADSAITVRVRYEVVEARELITSHRDDSFEPDPRFDQALQIRDRDRAASVQAVRDRAARLDPAQLLGSPLGSTGAPIVGPDGLVESGNGRVLSIRLAYREGMPGAEAYRNTLKGLGFAVDGMAEPVLIRRRLTELPPAERVRLADDANRDVIERRSASEEAKADARLLSPEVVGRLRPGALDAAENAEFVRAFIAALPKPEQAAMSTPEGRLSADGLARLERAVQAAAYGDAKLLATLLESTDEATARLGRSLKAAAPAVLAWRAAVAEGRILAQLDGTNDLVAAALLVRDARLSRRPLAELLDLPDDLMGGGPSAATRLWLALMLDRRANGTAAVVAAETLTTRVARAFALAEAAPQGPDMFGQPPPTIREVLIRLAAEEGVDLPYLPDRVPDFATPPPAPIGAARTETAAAPPAPATARAAEAPPAWTPDQVDAAGRPLWPEDVQRAKAEVLAARARLAATLGRADGPDIGTHLIDTPDREALRARAVTEVLTERVAAIGAVRAERKAVLVLGPPAAGKSTLTEPLARQLGALVIDADELKAKLPEFAAGRGAALVHEESAQLAHRLRAEVLAGGANVVLPIVGRTAERVRSEIAALKAAGYRVSLILADLPAEQAAARAIDRFRTTGRFVDPDYVLSVADGPKRAYMETRGLADEHAHYTTDGPRGSPPRFRDGSRDLLADVRLDAGSGRGTADAVGEQAGAGDPRRRAADPGTAADAAGTSRSGDDADLLVLTEAVDELARLGRLDETDLATIRQGNDAAAKAAAMADALDAAAACMLRAA